MHNDAQYTDSAADAPKSHQMPSDLWRFRFENVKKRSYEQLQLQQATVILLVTGQKNWALGKKDLLQKNHCVVAASAWITMDTCSILQPWISFLNIPPLFIILPSGKLT